MAKYLLAYTGGSMAETEQDQAAVMQAWGAWFGQLGEAVVDGGDPCGASAAVAADGSVSGGAPSGLEQDRKVRSDRKIEKEQSWLPSRRSTS
jgi:hypothetical protein